ncbi:MAG: hypothetical protein DRJ18_03365 [Candidatus Methanomethylicota archaeon]|nr:hypothetical protein [Candidatus Culexmicrobium cathedralense]RLE47359.1 MAG: hypothetical protein DRJ18_03365 [Candidatus Verstraetearchaeota archaeon]
MAKPITIIMVTADWEKASDYIRKACKKAAEDLKINLEEKKEDYEFLDKYGVKNEFGGLDIPQVFIKYDDGEIKYVMSRVPLTAQGTPDVEAAVEIIKKAVGG